MIFFTKIVSQGFGQLL